MESPESESSPEGHQRTRWSRIAERDFAHFYERYSGPVRRFLSARLPAEVDAEDLTQELFLRFHEKDFLGRADQERGSFRTFLFHAARQFLVDWLRRRGAAKRDSARTVPLDSDHDASDEGTIPPAVFDREWFLTLLNRARRAVKDDYEKRGRSDLYRAFHLFVFGDGSPRKWSQDEIVGELALTLDQVKSSIRRIKEAWRTAIREAVAEYADSDLEFDSEMAELAKFLDSDHFHGSPASRVLEPESGE